MKKARSFLSILAVLAVVVFMAGPAVAGNIFLTGHDDDFHQSAAAKAQMTGALAFVRAGSSLPVLTFDAGSELTSLMTSLGVAFTNINPNAGIPAASNFDVTKFSAFAVASDFRCGGCDNNDTSSTNLAGASAAIKAFFNAGGGIIGLAGATNAAYYSFLPATASVPPGSPPSTGYVQTADGLALGITAVNGDATHNFFNEPGTGGMDPLFKVVERLGSTSQVESVALTGLITDGGFTDGGGGVPEPATLLLLGAGLIGAAIMRKRAQS